MIGELIRRIRIPSPEKGTAETAGGDRLDHLIRTLPGVLYEYVRWPDGRNAFIYLSPNCEEIFGLPAEDAMQDSQLLWDLIHPDDRIRVAGEDETANRHPISLFHCEFRLLLPSGKIKWIELDSRPGLNLHDGQTVWGGLMLDISARKKVEAEKERLIEQLRSTRQRLDDLSSILPICASCKRIRDEQGSWSQVESYIQHHSKATFSHGICPECMKRLYPGI
jgi:PAS domain S-box-containing protein